MSGSPSALLQRDRVRAAVALDDDGMIDRDDRGAGVEVLDRVAAIPHDALDQAVGAVDRGRGVVGELGLRRLPGVDEALAGGRIERVYLELLAQGLALAQLALGRQLVARAHDGALVLGAEAPAQLLACGGGGSPWPRTAPRR